MEVFEFTHPDIFKESSLSSSSLLDLNLKGLAAANVIKHFGKGIPLSLLSTRSSFSTPSILLFVLISSKNRIIFRLLSNFESYT